MIHSAFAGDGVRHNKFEGTQEFNRKNLDMLRLIFSSRNQARLTGDSISLATIVITKRAKKIIRIRRTFAENSMHQDTFYLGKACERRVGTDWKLYFSLAIANYEILSNIWKTGS